MLLNVLKRIGRFHEGIAIVAHIDKMNVHHVFEKRRAGKSKRKYKKTDYYTRRFDQQRACLPSKTRTAIIESKNKKKRVNENEKTFENNRMKKKMNKNKK